MGGAFPAAHRQAILAAIDFLRRGATTRKKIVRLWTNYGVLVLGTRVRTPGGLCNNHGRSNNNEWLHRSVGLNLYWRRRI
jgi:hypothetical protein